MESDDDFQTQELNPRASRRTYLVTYSRADINRFPSRRDFGKIIKAAFNSGQGKAKVLHWACCLENHKDGVNKHYHVAIKLSDVKRWKKVKDNVMKDHGAVLNFSENHDNYYSAYKYICKSDLNVYHSKHHPNLENVSSPKTKKSTQTLRKRSLERRNSKTSSEGSNNNECKAKKTKRLSNIEVAEFITKNNIKRDIELMSLANARKVEGLTDLAEFIYNRSPKAISDLIENAWKMNDAGRILEREKLKRMDVVKEKLKGNCTDGCDGKVWLECAIEVLRNNNIHPFVYAAAMRDLLINGRGKFRNLLIVGPANSGKTFLLKPLELIFKTFLNPATDKYAWVGSDQCEVILLQDFRWCPELINWKDMLLLLEGETVKLPAPKNHFSSDVCINTDMPIFATSKAKIEYVGKFNSRDERETEMMDIRWKVFEFTKRIAEDKQRKLTPCARCFAELVLLGDM